jgi:hypothetical protein
MEIVQEIREQRKRPKLSDFLKLYQKNKHLPNAKGEF